VLGMRIIEHDARMNAARFANWEQDEQIAVVELGRKLADDPELVVAQLRRSSAGCGWLIGRWTLLENALLSADDGGPGCTWTDADLTLALNLLGRPLDLSHLDHVASRLETLREQASLGADEAVDALREIVADEVAELEAQREEVWQGVEEPTLQGWRAGVEIDLGPEGTRLHRYEAAADRLFRSAWTKLERLRKENGESLIDRSSRAAAPEPAPASSSSPSPFVSPAPPPPISPTVRRVSALLESTLLDDRVAPVLDIWAAGRPANGIDPVAHAQNKTNPAPGRPASGERTTAPGNLL
jgi:hypothetical protein